MRTALLAGLLLAAAASAGDLDVYDAEDYDRLAREAWAKIERDRTPAPPPAPPRPPEPQPPPPSP